MRIGRRWAGPGAALAGLLGFLVLLPTGWLYASTGAHRVSAERAPAAPVVIVLGAAVWDGEPSPFLAGRLDVAADLYRRGVVKAVLVSGDNGRKTYDEPTAMSRYLEGRGVPAAKVVRDYAGFDTWDSCVRAKKVFGVRRAIVVTQRFHLPRAVALCRAAGLDVDGVGHDSGRIERRVTRYGYAREGIASFKALADVVGRPKPRFLGPREPGVQQAIATP